MLFQTNGKSTLKYNILSFFLLHFVILNCQVYGINEIDINNGDQFFNNFTQLSINNNELKIVDIPSSNATNLTNNPRDSVYGQIATSENNVYIVWEESVYQSKQEKNYDVYFMKSKDKAETFDASLNISNNAGFSEHPQIAVSKNGIFIVWVDNTDSNNTEIMFVKSEDGGKSFSQPIKVSNSFKNSNNVEISAAGQNVYLVWQEIDQETNDASIVLSQV